MCESKGCQHKKESPLKDWKRRCKYGPDGRRLQNGTVIVGWNDLATTHPWLAKQLVGTNPATVKACTASILEWQCQKHPHTWKSNGNNRVKGRGCGVCANSVLLPGFNDMATTHPELAKEFLGDPTSVFAGTRDLLTWKCCVCPNKWKATGNNRVTKNKGCAVCSNKAVLKGWNDMATTHPELAADCLDDPTKHVAGTNKMLKWKCQVCPYKWKAPGYSRIKGCGCKVCAGTLVLKGWNDMATTHPDLAKECLNNPSKYVAGTHEMLNWKCSKCKAKWPATGHNRVFGRGCPECSKGKCGHNQTRPSFVYLIYRPGQIQYGIMNIWTNRLKNHYKKGWELFDKIEVTGQKARSLETIIKQSLKTKGIPTGREAFREWFDGWTEAFQEVDLAVSSIRELCDFLGIDLEAFLAA